MGNTSARVDVTDEITITPLYWASQLLKTFTGTREERDVLIDIFSFKRKRVGADGSVHVNDIKTQILSIDDAPLVQALTKVILPAPLRPRPKPASTTNNASPMNASTATTTPASDTKGKKHIEFSLTLNNISCIDFDLECKDLAPSVLVYQVVREQVKDMSMTLFDVLKQNLHSVDVMKQDAFQDAVYVAPIGTLYDLDYEKVKIIRRECSVMKESAFKTMNTADNTTKSKSTTPSNKNPDSAAKTSSSASDATVALRTLLHQVSFAASVRFEIDAEVKKYARRQYDLARNVYIGDSTDTDVPENSGRSDENQKETSGLLSGSDKSDGEQQSGFSFGNLSVSIPDTIDESSTLISPNPEKTPSSSSRYPNSQTYTNARPRSSIDRGIVPVGRRGSILDADVPGSKRVFVSHSLKKRGSIDSEFSLNSGAENSQNNDEDDGYLDYIDWVFVLCLGSERTMPSSVELVPVTFHGQSGNSTTNSEPAPSPRLTSASPTSLMRSSPSPIPLDVRSSSTDNTTDPSHANAALQTRSGLGGSRGSLIAPSPRNEPVTLTSPLPLMQLAIHEDQPGIGGSVEAVNPAAATGTGLNLGLSITVPPAQGAYRRPSIFDQSPAIGARRGSLSLPSPAFGATNSGLLQPSPSMGALRDGGTLGTGSEIAGRRNSILESVGYKGIAEPSPMLGGRRGSIVPISPAVGSRRPGFWNDEPFSLSETGSKGLGGKTPVLNESSPSPSPSGNSGSFFPPSGSHRRTASTDADGRVAAIPESRGTVIELTDKNKSASATAEATGGDADDASSSDSEDEEVQPHVVGVCFLNTRELYKKLRTIEKRKEKEGNLSAKYTYRTPIRAVDGDGVWSEVFAGEDIAMLITPTTVVDEK